MMQCLSCLADSSQPKQLKEDEADHVVTPTSNAPARPARQPLPRTITKASISPSTRPPFVEAIREWLTSCDEKHSCAPQSSPDAECRPPTWVIDTREQCLVPGSKAGRYLALSYRWQANSVENTDGNAASSTPNHQPLQLDRSLLSRFQSRGALSKKEIARQLPKVILDAIELTANTGERYLWVDRLCVVQNEPDTMAEVTRMDQIYSGAYLVLVAAAPHGLYEKPTDSLHSPEFQTGFYQSDPDETMPTFKQDEVDRIGREEYYRFEVMQFYWQLRETEWATRGWTYQEHVLCRRAIFFLGRRLVWECRCAVWDTGSLLMHHWTDGDDACPSNAAGKSSPALRLSTQSWPDFGLWMDVVCPFNARNFTFQSDALIAISGILNSMARVFAGGFVGGLPALFLDHALLWQPLRKAKRRGDAPPGSKMGLPSWSWCGWQAPVSPWSMCSGVAYIDNDKNQELASSWRTRNLVTWSAVRKGIRRFEAVPIIEPVALESLVEGAENGLATRVDESTGWHRDTKTIVNTSSEDELMELWLSPTFTHDTDRAANFKHPIPLRRYPSPKKAALHTYGNDTFMLSCDAIPYAVFRPAALLHASDLYPPFTPMALTISATEHTILTQMPPINEINPVLVLQDRHGRFSGVLRLMSLDDNDSSTDVSSESEKGTFQEKENVGTHGPNLGGFLPDQQIELIAISKGSARRDELEDCFEERVFRRNMASWPDDYNSVMFDMTRLDPSFDITPSFTYQQPGGIGGGELKNKWEGEIRPKPASLWGPDNAPSDKDDPNRKRENERICHFYNVLWIERKDGIAYRRACGRIPKHVWDRNDLGDVQVILG